MLRHRVMPCLLVRNGGLVKTTRFEKPIYVGDPMNVVRIFNEKEVDEIVILDISATPSRSGPNYDLLEQLAGECFMPLCYGGGISTLEQAAQIFDLGIEKVCLQSGAIRDPRLITRIAERYGSQAVMVSVDVKRSWRGRPDLYRAAERKKAALPWNKFVREAVSSGAGEILLNSVDRDGTMSGPDVQLISEAAAGLRVPLVAIGGIGSLQDIRAAIDAGADAVAAGAYFVFHGPHRAVLVSYPSYQTLTDLLEQA